MLAERAVGERPKLPICWHAESFDPKIASVRLRALQPMRALNDLGHPVRTYRDGTADCAAIIFSKSDSPEALAIAEAAKRENRRIIYDVCDNIFEKPPANERRRQRLERAKMIMRHAGTSPARPGRWRSN